MTDVEIPIHRPGVILCLLQLCPNLRSLTIRVTFNETAIFEPLVHIKIQSLRIVIDGSTSDLLPGLFDAFSLPNLRALEVHSVQWPYEEFKSFLTRSNCPLETLILGTEVKMRDEQRAQCVALIPSLEILVSLYEDL
ncbi:hypothetical protein BD769DRAFT_1674097 [Suillus cothurnatus]|nr:hypothetical protein BD769DRAFT_1674097 [Suillus cothurnatus]